MSSIDLIARYVRERGRPSVLGPLAGVLAGAGAFVAPSDVSLVWYATSVIQAFLLVLAFRVWDDLADRERDTMEHPNRITVVEGRRRMTFVMFGCGLALGALTSLSLEPDLLRRVVALALAVTLLEVWYNTRGRSSGGALGGHIVLLKYPAIAYAVAPRLTALGDRSPPSRGVSALASVYLLTCIYEYFDDPTMRASDRARHVAATELVLLVPLVIVTVGIP